MNIKKIMSAGISAIIGFSGVFSVSAVSPVSAAENDSLLVFGDSIASGYNAYESFGKIAADYLDADYKNTAVPGYTTEDLLKSIDASKDIVDDYDSIVISAGGNNYLRVIGEIFKSYLDEGDDFTDLNEEKLKAVKDKVMADKANAMVQLSKVTAVTDPAVADLTKAAAQIKELNPDADIYVLTLYNPFESAASLHELAEMMSGITDSVLADFNTKVSAIDGVTAVPVGEAFKGLTTSYVRVEQTDIHPNDAGQIKIASLLLNKMTGENEKLILGKIFGTLTDAQLAALPDVLKEGVDVVKPEVTTTAVTTTALPETTSVTTITSVYGTTNTTVTTTENISGAQTTTAATTTTPAATSTSSASTTTAKVASSPATSDKGVSALVLTGLLSAVACVFLRKSRA